MKVQMSGSINGQPYPDRGQVGALPDVVGAKLCAAGIAEPADGHQAAVETTSDNRPVETRSDDEDVEALRSEAKTAGVKVDKRWGADRLREEIAAVSGD
jgi:hypothetical protein